jgi:hypothetical protein
MVKTQIICPLQHFYTDSEQNKFLDGVKFVVMWGFAENYFLNLMFMCLCITSIIINDDQQDATILDLFISSLLYMFRAIPPTIIRST